MDIYFDKFSSLLKNSIGLDCNTIGKSSLENILNQRMSACKIDSIQDYYQYVSNSSDELKELLEFSVIPETWFFRDIRPFEIIHEQIKSVLSANKDANINILSIPCSTGEEPYSIAMYMIEKNIPENSFHIDAVDISHRALQHAEIALYGKNSFRGQHYQAYKEKYFTPNGSLFQLQEKIYNKVKFNRLNILHDSPALEEKYDFILCRNLLIYFDSKTKEKAFQSLEKLLKKSGLLFIGHSEFGAVPEKIFQNLGSSMSFALCKTDHPCYIDKSNEVPQRRATGQKPKKLPPIENKKVTFSSFIQSDTSNVQPKHSEESEKILLQARLMANAAQYIDSEKLCMQYIENHGEHQDILYLLGLIASSKQQISLAESMLRKALFLDPNHYEALIHLSLLLQEKGDHVAAERLRLRADKAHYKDL